MNKSKILLWSIFFFFLIIRLYIAFQTPTLNYDGYYVVNQVNEILYDSYEENETILEESQNYIKGFYYYLLALFSFVFPLEFVLKTLPNILGSLVTIIAYYLSYLLTKNEYVSLTSSFFAGSIPIFFISTINNASIYNFAIPLLFLCLYYFILTCNDSKHSYKLILFLIILSISHFTSVILAGCFLLYLVLTKLQGFRNSVREPEIIIFYTLFVFWVTSIVYSKTFVSSNSLLFWQNVPTQILNELYSQLTSLNLIYGIGLISLIAGFITIYDSFFNSKRKAITVLSSLTILSFILLLFQSIEFNLGLILMGVSLCILSSVSISKLYSMLKYTKIKNIENIMLLVLITFQFVLFLPGFSIALNVNSQGPSDYDIKALKSIENSEKGVILSLPEEGSASKYFSNQSVVSNMNFLGIENVDVFYNDLISIYTDRFLTTSLEKLNFYGADYIFLSQRTQNLKNITSLRYDDEECIVEIYNNVSKIYEVRCVLDEN